jgi:hypothetical protein
MKYLVQYHYQKQGPGIKLYEGFIYVDIDSVIESEIVEKAREGAMKHENVTSVKIGTIKPL